MSALIILHAALRYGGAISSILDRIRVHAQPSERERNKNKNTSGGVLIRRPGKITEKHGLGLLLPPAGGEVAQGRGPIKKKKKNRHRRRRRRGGCGGIGGDSSGSRGREQAFSIDRPGPARPEVQSEKEEPPGNFFAPRRTQGIHRVREAMGRMGSDSSS